MHTLNKRIYAVGIVSSSLITSIAERHVSLQEAASFVQAYNCLDGERQAVILAHPISRAISHARSKSRDS